LTNIYASKYARVQSVCALCFLNPIHIPGIKISIAYNAIGPLLYNFYFFDIFIFLSTRDICYAESFFFLVNCGMFAGIYSHCAFVRLFTIAIAIATTHSFGSFNTILTFLTPFCTRCRYKAQYHCIYHKKSLTFVVSNFFHLFLLLLLLLLSTEG
jgi:hypothetical protein